MFSHRLFNIVIAITLIVVIGLTVREAAATSIVVSQNDFAKANCASLPSHFSIHMEYVKERNAWVTYTDDGPTGVDGGLIQLLSDHRACSK